MHILTSLLTESLGPDWAGDILRELNQADSYGASQDNQTYTLMCDAFHPILAAGSPFVAHGNALAAVANVESDAARLASEVRQLSAAVHNQKLTLRKELEEAKKDMQLAVMGVHQEEHFQIAREVRDAELPFPFASMEDCEDYFSAPENSEIAETAFRHDDTVLKERAKLRLDGQDAFPARVVVRFLLTRSCILGTDNFKTSIGKGTATFICEASRYLMGPAWCRDNSDILDKVRKHLAHAKTYVPAAKKRRDC